MTQNEIDLDNRWPFVPDRACMHCEAPLSDAEAKRGRICDTCREIGAALGDGEIGDNK